MANKGTVGIIGSGLVGSSWAMIFASAGYEVKLYDVNQEQISTALNNIRTQLEKLASIQMLRGKLTCAQQFSLIKGVTSLEACVKNAKYVQECVFEDLDLKTKVFKELDQIVSPNTILASSASCIVPSKISANLKNKSNFVVSHPVNPPYFVPLVEIIPAPWTCQEVVKKTRDLMEEVGQSPIVLKKEIAGFALNRLQYVLLNECFHLVNDGILSAEDVDKVMTEGLAYRYLWFGPLQTAHLNAPKGMKDYIERYGPTMEGISATFKEPPEWNKSNGKEIIENLDKQIPLEKIKEKCHVRDERLSAVSKLKKDMENDETSS